MTQLVDRFVLVGPKSEGKRLSSSLRFTASWRLLFFPSLPLASPFLTSVQAPWMKLSGCLGIHVHTLTFEPDVGMAYPLLAYGGADYAEPWLLFSLSLLLLLSVLLEPLSRGLSFPNDHVFGKSNLYCTGRLIANNIPILYDRVSRVDDVASHIRQSGT